ncbi:unnamed protein product [Urochloa decumbens]|uniref:Uncharacterized protein n=1 Tax=Urochloa decumbens TaxID=240449 RepID=A0ABC9B6P1_9POAL
MDKMLEHSVEGHEKVRGEGSVAARAEGKGISRVSVSVAEIEEAKMPENSGTGAKEKLIMDGSETSRAEEIGNCSSWVVNMEKIQEASGSAEMARWEQHSIYRVPEFIKKETNRDAYQPQFVSLGPYHHGEPHLLPMEEHKRRAVLHVVNRARKPLGEFIAAIEQVADELEATYNDLGEKWRGANKGRFVEMMVSDGCFMLEFIRAQGIRFKGKVNEDYATNDPIFSVRSNRTLWATVWRDTIAMENQMPLAVLQRLLAVQLAASPSAKVINNLVRRLLCLDSPRFEEDVDNLGHHFLDILHKSYCGTSPQWEGSDKYPLELKKRKKDKYDPRTPCAVELNEAGIRFKRSNTNSIHDVDFENGVLSMPLFKLHDYTEIELLNLMAFEWLHPNAKRDVVSYISFVDKITESERDVALLRSEGLFENMIGSDKAVVKMFNILTNLAVTPEYGSMLGYVQWKVNDHCRKRRNKWRAIFVNTYLSNPWVFISMVAAVILLIATLLQTVYTAVPFYTKS